MISDIGMKVSIVIPVYNEEQALPLVLKEIPRDHTHQIIVVDNGSTDGTFAAAQRGNVLVVEEPRRGYGSACLAGLLVVAPDTDVVVFLDGDHSDYSEELPLLLAPIVEGRADLVIGSRVLGSAEPGSLTPHQRFGNWLACKLLAMRFGATLTDLGPFRAIRRSALQEMRMQDIGFGWNVEMQAKALKAKLRIVEVPVRYRPRIGQSKISGTVMGSLRAATAILTTIAKYW